jgi:hypothetical protein
MSDYYISYEETVPWNGSIFNANEYRRAINSFYSKVDLVKPNAIVEDGATTPSISVKNLSPDANFPNEWNFSLSGKFSTSKRDELTGNYLANVTLSGDVKVPRQTSSGKTLKSIIASDFKTTRGIGKTPGEAFNNAFKQLRESLLQTLADQVGISGKGIKVERQDAFTDPDPALVGPPTQTINGVANKAPVVDNPNIKLPTQEVKGLDANAAQQAASKAQDVTSNATSQVQSAAGGLTSQVQGAAGQAQGALEGAAGQVQGAAGQAQGALEGAASQVQGAAGQAQGALEGATGQAQGVIGGAQESAGGVLSNLSSGVKGAIGGGALGAGIGALAGGGKGALIGAGAGLVAGGIAGKVFDKLNPKGIKPDGLGKDWSPDKYSPESIAGNTKFVNAKTGVVESTSELAKGLKGGLLGGALGAGVGALAGGGKGALIGGLSGTALGAGLSVGGVTGGALAGGGLGAGIGGIVGGGKGAVIGAVSGGAVGAAAAKLASVQKGMPKPNIPKPPSTPRIKTIKIPRPSYPKGATDLLNLPKSPLG